MPEKSLKKLNEKFKQNKNVEQAMGKARTIKEKNVPNKLLKNEWKIWANKKVIKK